MEEKKLCHDCGVEPGQHHLPGCDTERCPKCYGQLISCGCFLNDDEEFDEEEFDKYEQDIWTGVMFDDAKKICEAMNLYSKLIIGQGWVLCSKHEEGATYDLNTGVKLLMEYGKPKLKK